ncbi:MAG: hypothetical protein HEQ40_12065 [Lacibacter sp.]|jgi:hypothetical protein
MNKHLNDLIQGLNDSLKEQKDKNSQLHKELQLLQDQVYRLKRQLDVYNVLTPFFKEYMTLAACDLLIDPSPVDLKCGGDKAGQQLIYSVRLLDILAIVSKGKYKEIHLRTAVIPKEGGTPKSKLIFAQDGIDFEKLLFMIQRRGEHLLKVQKSGCINLYHYEFKERNLFVLKNRYHTTSNTDVHQIRAGSFFKKDLYHQRMFEIQKLKDQAHKSLKVFQEGEGVKQKLYDIGLLD